MPVCTGHHARRGGNGCELWFWCWAGLAPEGLVCGEVGLNWGFSGVGVWGGSGGGVGGVVVGETLRMKRVQGWCSTASVSCRRGT